MRTSSPFNYRIRRILPLGLMQLEARMTPAYSQMGPYSLIDLQNLAKSSATVWQVQPELPAAPIGSKTYFDLQAFVPSQLNVSALATYLAKAPAESAAVSSHPLELALPKPDGTFERFKIWEVAMMEPKLASKFPQFKTYRGQGIDDPAATLAADVTSLGFHAQVLAPDGRWYIDPYWHLQTTEYVSYSANDLHTTLGNGCSCALCQAAVSDVDQATFSEGTDGDQSINQATGEPGFRGPPPGGVFNGTELHTYRLAVAADGEYTTFFGGTTEKGQAAIVTAINRINQVYENELAIRLTLVNNNDLLVFTDPNSDPYTNGDPDKLWTENQKTIDDTILSANYDIGHVFTTGSGGKGDIGSVGQNGRKAQGTTGQAMPTGDAFWIDFVAHEFGHQFGATHTFNGAQSKNASQRTAATAVEPGSGTTIMSYAGVMGADNVQLNSDSYFHIVSIENILNYVATIPTVGTTTPLLDTLTGWFVPINSMVIPAETPFSLSMGAFDSGGNTITYTFEERDLGPAQALLTPDNGSSPLFRSRPPSTVGTRYFPQMNILAANGTPANFAEQLPTTNRTMNFTATARNNAAGGGAIVSIDNIMVQVVTAAGPFRVTEPSNIDTKWAGNSSQTISWTVEGTTKNGINASNVEITMSTDGGLTFPITILASTPNDGAEIITVPNMDAEFARFKVTGISDGVGKTFYDINDVNISITFTPKVTVWTGAEPLTSPNTWENSNNWSNGVPGAGDTAIFQAGSKGIAPMLSGPTSLGKLQIESSWPGQLILNAPLTLTGTSTWNAGSIVIAAGSSVTNIGTVTMNNPTEIRITGGGTWTNNGTMTLAGKGELNIDGLTTSLETPIGAVFDMQSDSGVDSNSSTGNKGSFNVAGTLLRSPGIGTATGYIYTRSRLTGVIDVRSTTLAITPFSTTGDITGVTMKVAPGATLAIGQSISYAGQLRGSGGGTVRLDVGNSMLAGSTTFDFPGAMLQWVGGDLNLNGKSLDNLETSTINVTGGSFHRLTGDGTFINYGTFIDESPTAIYLNGANTKFFNPVGAIIDFQGTTGGFSYENTSGTFNNTGMIRRSVGTGNVTLQTNFAISGPLEVLSGTLTMACFVPGSGTVSNVTATIDKSATLDMTGLQSTVNYAGTLTCVGGPNGIGTVKTGVFGQINIIADTTLNFPDNMFQWIGGTIKIAPNASLFNPAGSFMTLSNGGFVTLNGGGTLVNDGWMRHTNSGNLNISGTGTTLKNSASGTYDLQTNAGFAFSGMSGTFLNQGVLRKSVTTGNSIVTATFINDGGIVDIQTGFLDTPGTFDLGKGTLQGNGTLVSPVTNTDGNIRPGNSPGKLTINGNYVQSGTGSLNIELNGTTVGSQYDQLAINGTVTLDGPLSVVLNYPAKGNDTFVIINNDNFASNDAVSGTFDGLIEGATFNVNSALVQISYKGGDGNDVQLKVISAPTIAPPKITGIQVNDGSTQRSRVTSLQITFDQHVILPPLPASAFELKRSKDAAVVTLLPTVDDSGTGTIITFQFTGGPLNFGSLADGLYTLTATASLITSAGGTLDGNGNGIAEGSSADDYLLIGDTITNKLFRLFGDTDGNGTSSAADFNALRLAYGTTGPSPFDFNGDNATNASDFNEFRLRYGVTLMP